MDFLNPRLQDRHIRAYAFLEAEFSAGARSAVECLLPFLQEATAQFEGNFFDAQQVADFLSATYRLDVPLYMFDTLVRALERTGSVVYDRDVRHHICCKTKKSDQEYSRGTALSEQDLQRLESSLETFAKEYNLPHPQAVDSWSEALINFFQNYQIQNQPTKVVHGQITGNPQRFDDFIVSSFVRHTQLANPDLFSIVRRLYYGVLIGEFLTSLQTAESAEDFSGLTVFYDSTVLLRILGTSGELLKTATIQMHDSLQSLGCHTRYFPHIYSEAVDNLGAVIAAIDSGEHFRIYDETREALYAGEVSESFIRMLPNELDVRLGQLTITEFPDEAPPSQYAHQISEEDFSKKLAETRTSSGTVRDARDAQSLGLIIRLRNDSHATSLAKAKYILLTHNERYSKVARRYLYEQKAITPHQIPPILDLATMSVATFLAHGATFSNQRIDSQLAAACYAARLPNQDWEREFWNQLERLEADSEETKELIQNHLVRSGLRNIVRDESMGSVTLLKKVNFLERFEEAKARSEHEKQQIEEAAKSKGRELGREDHSEKLKSFIIRSIELAFRITLGGIGVVITYVALKFVFIDMNHLPSPRSVFFLLSELALAVAGIVSMLISFGIIPRLNLRKAASKIGGSLHLWLDKQLRRT